MPSDPTTCPMCGARSTHVVWSLATLCRMVVNGVLIPLWMVAGYFGDMRNMHLAVDHECGSCGAHFIPGRRWFAKNG